MLLVKRFAAPIFIISHLFNYYGLNILQDNSYL